MSFSGQKHCTWVVAFLLRGGKCDQCKPSQKGEKGKTFCGFLQIPMYLSLCDLALHAYCKAVIHLVTTLPSPCPFSKYLSTTVALGPLHRAPFHSLAQGCLVVPVSFIERRHSFKGRFNCWKLKLVDTTHLIQVHTCSQYVDYDRNLF